MLTVPAAETRSQNVPEIKIQFGRQREATKGGLLARPIQQRFKSWPDSKSRKERETNIPALLALLFSEEDGDTTDGC
jgi:hypothetical protein